MVTALFTAPVHQQHLVPPHHPETPARQRAIEQALQPPAFTDLARHQSTSITPHQVALVHSRKFIESLNRATMQAKTNNQLVPLTDGDTFVSHHSLEASLHAAGAACAAVDLLFEDKADNAFCAVRPPGHHSNSDVAGGFCLINSIAVAARHAMQRWSLERVAIVDFDVHHGNGTQDIFAADPAVLYLSSHQMPLYPGSGFASETGAGNLVNLPLAGGSGSAEFRAAWQERGFPALLAHRPDLILVSAGFDAHYLDPLAGLCLDEQDYAWITDQLIDCANLLCGGRLVSVLEGGYHLEALARSVARHVQSLCGARARYTPQNPLLHSRTP